MSATTTAADPRVTSHAEFTAAFVSAYCEANDGSLVEAKRSRVSSGSSRLVGDGDAGRERVSGVGTGGATGIGVVPRGKNSADFIFRQPALSRSRNFRSNQDRQQRHIPSRRFFSSHSVASRLLIVLIG